MLILYSKQTGRIVTIIRGDSTNETIREIFPYDYQDYELVYDLIRVEDDDVVANTPSMFRVVDGRVVLNIDEKLAKYNL